MTMQEFEHGGNVYLAQSPTGSWLDFSANINPLGLAQSAQKAIAESIGSLIHYPDPEGRELKQAISVHYNVPEANICLGNGAAELFYVYFHTVRPKKVLIPVPSFSEYERSARGAGVEVKRLFLQEEKSFSLDLDGICQEMADCNTVLLGNPNNPTGELLKRDFVTEVVKEAKKRNIDVLVDESFLDFRQDRLEYSVLNLVNEFDNLLVVSSLTKFYAIPGLRLGFGAASQELVHQLDFNKDPWNVNLLAQKAGVAVLADKAYQNESRNLLKDEIKWLYNRLLDIPGLTVYEPRVNFILLNLTKCGITSRELSKAMRDKGILIRDCSNYPGLDENYVRVAVRNREENVKLVKALNDCLE